jgi:hypothetical protein
LCGAATDLALKDFLERIKSLGILLQMALNHF